jgi:hypothetical protein
MGIHAREVPDSNVDLYFHVEDIHRVVSAKDAVGPFDRSAMRGSFDSILASDGPAEIARLLLSIGAV